MACSFLWPSWAPLYRASMQGGVLPVKRFPVRSTLPNQLSGFAFSFVSFSGLNPAVCMAW